MKRKKGKFLMRIILASKSPRRRELLKQIGIEYECIVSDKEEKLTGNTPKEVVLGLSLQKAEDVYELVKGETAREDTLIIGADTVVALGNNIMGKPKDNDDAVRMLKLLNKNKHSVWTGVTLICVKNGAVRIESFARETKVFMYEMSDREINDYVDSKEPQDKAGAYAIQGMGARFIEKIEGDYNNVVGLPVAELYHRIEKILIDK